MSASELPDRDALLRMTNGFQASQAIHVAATLGIADLLAGEARRADELAEAAGRTRPPSTGCCARCPASACSPRGTTTASA